MKFSIAGRLHAVALSAFLVATAAPGQTTSPQLPAPQQPPPPAKPQGKVIFSRSAGQNEEATAPPGQPKAVTAPVAQDAERRAVAFTSLNLDVHLHPATHEMAVRALLTVRNSSEIPLAHIPLQISSSLRWDGIRVGGKDVAFPVATINSDADHTGQLHEAAVTLAHPLAPGATLALDVTYSGAIASNAQRLLALGTPQETALHSDWDQIDTAFTGLRGFGNVVWYPVSSVPVMLGDGARLFDEIGEHKLRLVGARFQLRLTIEFPHGQAPTIALVNGHPAALTITDAGPGEPDVASVATAEVAPGPLGFEAPSLFVAIRTVHPGPNLNAWTTPDNNINVQFWIDAAGEVTPFLQGWLGQTPRAQLTLLDLPDPDDAPFETGALLAAGLKDADAHQLDGVLAHALTHAWMQSPRAWLSEGVAHFMGTLWLEKQEGRDKALSALEAGRSALALIEPSSPGISPGQPLPLAISPVYYRTKAAYVLWMLRDIVGDPALSAALRAYNPEKDSGTSVPGQLETLLEQAGQHRDLSWFFADWVDTDKGLPDLTIDNAFPTPESAGNWLLAVNVSNAGYAAAEVPVTVRTAVTTITQRLRIPARGKAVQRILIQGRPTEVQLNDGTVPETQASVHVVTLEEKPAPTP